MNIRSLAVLSLALLGAGVLVLMAYLAFRSGANLEAAGWLTAGFLSLREVVSKIENVAMNIRNASGEQASGKPGDPVHVQEET